MRKAFIYFTELLLESELKSLLPWLTLETQSPSDAFPQVLCLIKKLMLYWLHVMLKF